MKTLDLALTEKTAVPEAERRRPAAVITKAGLVQKNRSRADGEKLAMPDTGIGQDESMLATEGGIAAMAGEMLLPLSSAHAQRRSEAVSSSLLLSSESGESAPIRDETIIGSGDRAHHLAMIAVTVTPFLRRAPVERAASLPSLRPSSRAECENRCGADGFCDPSSEFGCGGEHCIHLHEALY